MFHWTATSLFYKGLPGLTQKLLIKMLMSDSGQFNSLNQLKQMVSTFNVFCSTFTNTSSYKCFAAVSCKHVVQAHTLNYSIKIQCSEAETYNQSSTDGDMWWTKKQHLP